VGRGGQTRKRLERRLSLAYDHGLLSEDTYVSRIHELLFSPVIDTGRLAGDLNLREPDGNWRREIGETLIAPIAQVRAFVRDRYAGRDDALLALDWSGAKRELSLGRDLGCDVVFEDRSVSRLHARLHFRYGRWILQDLASKNGSWVNGVRVGRSELRAGDVLILGDKRLVVD
jgi:hypothetical protein